MAVIRERKLDNGIAVLEAGAGSPVVFLHGISGAARSWTLQLPAFAAKHRAVAWDMPGHGRSDAAEELTFAGLTASLHEMISGLSLHRPILIGHSMGAMVALDYVTKHPQVAAGLVLDALSPAFAVMDEAMRATFERQHLEPLAKGKSLADLNRAFVKTMHGPKADKAGLDLAEAVMAAADPRAYQQTVHCTAHFADMGSLALLPMPTLVVTGEHDRNAPVEATKKMAAAIPHHRLRTIEAAGSLAHVERPEAFNRVVLDFVDHVRERG